MVSGKSPTPRDRRMGARLRVLRRERTNLTLEMAARRLELSPAMLSRIENGKRRISPEEVATIVAIYGLPAAERDAIVEDAKGENEAGWWNRPLPGVPEEMGVLASYASEADSLTNWAVTLVPGLLQIEDYARGLMLSDGVSPEDADLRWVARRRRQEILGSVDYTAFICETALRIPFGGPAAHRAQLRHLLAARDRGVAVRIFRDRQPVGLISHSWLYMTFPNTQPVVNVEVLEGGFYLEGDQAELYTSKVKLLHDRSLSVPESQDMLRSMMEEIV